MSDRSQDSLPAGTSAGQEHRPRRVLRAATALLVLLALAEGAARLVGPGPAPQPGELAAYLDVRNATPVFRRVERDGVAHYQRDDSQPLVVRNTSFPVTKAPGTLRVFVVGASAAAGWPHQDQYNGYTISALLRQKLERLLPGRRFEVINCSGSTYATHRVKLLFDEVLGYEPDLIVLYAGNNEFVEAFPFRPRLSARPWAESALVRAIDRLLEVVSGHRRPVIDMHDYGEHSTVANRVSLMFGQPSKYWLDPDLHRQIVERYRYNMRAMLRAARQRGVRLIVTRVPVNLKQWIPNVSVHGTGLGPRELERWQAHFRDGLLAREAGELERAVAELERAAAIDDAFAEGHFELGRALQAMGRLPQAREAYLRALDRDAFPYRETSELARVLEQVAGEEQQPLLDSVALLEARAGDGICGLECAIDHVHLTGASQEAIAHGVLEEMARRGLIAGPLALPIESTRIEVPQLYDELATDLGVVSIYRAAAIMRQHDQLDSAYANLVRVLQARAASRPASAADTHRQLSYAGQMHQALLRYRELLRAEKLGLVEARFSAEEARAIFDDYVALVRAAEGARMPAEEFERLVPAFAYRSTTGAGPAAGQGAR